MEVPNAVVSVKYTKSLYWLEVEQLTAERKKAYYQGSIGWLIKLYAFYMIERKFMLCYTYGIRETQKSLRFTAKEEGSLKMTEGV